ncbi:MAG: histidine ammonia-lyase [Candidatus Izemoplasmatales bacterium]
MLHLNGSDLDLQGFIRVARRNEGVAISADSMERTKIARAFVDAVADAGTPVYGINTGFGKLSDVKIAKRDVGLLQKNLIMSHACGVGNPLPVDAVRGMMLLRVNALVKGYSGVRPETVLKLVEFLNRGITPVVYEKGSLGASGDLAPLSQMCLPLLALGEVWVDGKRLPALEGLAQKGVAPIESLGAKEGIALINGTQAMTAIGALALYDCFRLARQADLAASLTFEALGGIPASLDPRVHALRNQSGQIDSAKRILANLAGSKHLTRPGEKRVQDAYSLRCAPQVHGASLGAFRYVKGIVEAEMNAVTDNPIVFPDAGDAVSAGNFHGQPLALAFDYLGIAVAELADISERRLERLVNPQLSEGLPPFLGTNCGVNSGFMIVQYSAASLVSENKVLAHPASVDSIPSSANQEDHVSMGTIAARKALEIVGNVRKVIAMETMSACQAIDLRPAAELGAFTTKAHAAFRRRIPKVESDVVMYPLIEAADGFLRSEDYDREVYGGEPCDE